MAVLKRLRQQPVQGPRTPPLDEDGVPMVWDIFENAYVTRGYWEWVNGRGLKESE